MYRNILSILFISLSLIILCTIILEWPNQEGNQNKISFFETDSLNSKVISDKILNNDRIFNNVDEEYIVYWRQFANEELINPILNRTGKTNIIIIKGLPSILVDTKNNTPLQNNQCIIDKITAYNLFGANNVEGLMIRYGKDDYFISDVIEYSKPICIVSGTADESYDRITIDAENSMQKFEIYNTANQVLHINDILDYNFLNWVVEIALAFHLIFLCLALMYFIKYHYFPGSKSKYAIKLCNIAFIIVTFTILINVNYPSEMIPTRWSDFEFWEEILLSKKANIESLFTRKMTALDLNFIFDICERIIRIITSSVLLIIGFIVRRVDYDRNSFKKYKKSL